MSLVLYPPKAAGRRLGHYTPIAVVRGGTRDSHILGLEEFPEMGEQLLQLCPDEQFELLPETRQGMRSVYHIVGPSGAGKSTVAAGFARNFNDLYPDGKVIVVSTIEDPDPAFEDVDHQRIGISEELNDISMPDVAAMSDGSPTLLIFDDVEGLDKKREAALQNFQQRALETGRKLGIHVLSLFHRPAAGRSTKCSLAECNGLVLFPRANNGANMDYTLKTYFGVPPAVKACLKKGWGRWILVRTDGMPGYFLGENRAAIYDPDEVADAVKRRAVKERTKATAKAKAEVAREEAGADGVDIEELFD